jgi:hypothetical protein
VPTLEPEPIRAGVWQDLIDRDVARADEARRSADSKEERAWLELVGKHMASACTDERERLKLHFDAPPLTVIFEGLADAPPASFPPPPLGASDDPIAGVTPLPVRQGGNQ